MFVFNLTRQLAMAQRQPRIILYIMCFKFRTLSILAYNVEN